MLSQARVRPAAAVVAALCLDAALDVPLRDWAAVGVLAACGVLVAVLAGAAGGVIAGLVAGAGGWTLYWIFVADNAVNALIALPAWLAAGALSGALARGIASAARDREEEFRTTKERLGEAQARFRALTQSLPLVTYIRSLDANRAPLFVSAQIEQLTGYSAAEWSRDGDLLLRLVDDVDRERVQSELERAATTREPFRAQYRLRTRDGRAVTVRDEAVVVLDGDGQPSCFEGWMLDVSERVAAADERRRLREAEATAQAFARDRQRQTEFLAKAAALVAASSNADDTLARLAALTVKEVADWCVVHRLDDDGKLVRVVAERAEGSSTPEPEADVAAVVRRQRPSLSEAEIAVPIVSNAGRTRGALTIGGGRRRRSLTADDLGWLETLGAFIALSMEMSQLHDEVEARAEADRVLSYVGDGVFLLDRAGVVRLWNPAAEAITGSAAADVLGRSVVEAVPAWEQIADRIPIGPVGQPTPAAALPLETLEGERWVSISGVEFFGGTVYAFRDVTDAHRLDELQAEFIATASHELRTPLAAVYGAAQTLRRHDFALDEAGRERFISLIVDESERLGRIVNQILLANQLEMGRLDVNPEAFDARDLLERVAEAARTHTPPAIELEVSVEDGVPPIAADKDHVRQILINLVENAIKYSPDGGTIELGVEAIEGLALFHVFDEGIGIPEDEQPRVFEKFYRLDPHMTRGIGGTGLGLYICNELVGRMGGRIWVESHGRGSAFYFELPIAAAARPVRARELRTDSAAT